MQVRPTGPGPALPDLHMACGLRIEIAGPLELLDLDGDGKPERKR